MHKRHKRVYLLYIVRCRDGCCDGYRKRTCGRGNFAVQVRKSILGAGASEEPVPPRCKFNEAYAPLAVGWHANGFVVQRQCPILARQWLYRNGSGVFVDVDGAPGRYLVSSMHIPPERFLNGISDGHDRKD